MAAPPAGASPGPLDDNDSRAIAFGGEVVGLLPLGLRRVRLENGHVVTVLPAFGRPTGALLVGDPVVVEIAFNQLKGWRFVRPSRSALQEPETP